MSRSRHEIAVQIATHRKGVPHADALRKWARAALSSANCSLTIRVVGRAESHKLNSRWRSMHKPTNVLSFPYSLASGFLLGDLVLCAPVVAREAREQGKPLRAHWAHMVIHGVLHLRGYDHVRNRDAKKMEALEKEILSGFGYPDPYLGSS